MEEESIVLGNFIRPYNKNGSQFKINVNKKFFNMIDEGKKRIEILFDTDSIDIKIGDVVTFKNKKDILTKSITGIAHYDNLSDVIEVIDTKNCVGKTNVKAMQWYEKHYQDRLDDKIILISW